MTALKWITTEAKKIKKQHPHRFKKWTDYVAQASAIYASKHKGKSPVGKKHKVSGVKKKVVKKKVVKKSPVRSLHKDTKSHNVNIRVMSGIDGAVQHLNSLINEKAKALKKIDAMQIALKNTGEKDTKKHFKFWIARYKKFVTGLNKQISESKKHIK